MDDYKVNATVKNVMAKAGIKSVNDFVTKISDFLYDIDYQEIIPKYMFTLDEELDAAEAITLANNGGALVGGGKFDPEADLWLDEDTAIWSLNNNELAIWYANFLEEENKVDDFITYLK